MWATIGSFLKGTIGSIFGSVETTLFAICGGVMIAGGIYIVVLRHDATAAQNSAAISQASLNMALAANAAQEKAIAQITKMRAQDDKLLQDFQDKVSAINSQMDDANAKLDALEKGNAQVRDFLSTNLPPDLQRMLNGPDAPSK
jgi:septal ring factor EnvC (AmiA/AmiB activator)